MYVHALVTIVLERAWAALKCDQLPVGKLIISFLPVNEQYITMLFDSYAYKILALYRLEAMKRNLRN